MTDAEKNESLHCTYLAMRHVCEYRIWVVQFMLRGIQERTVALVTCDPAS